MEITLTIPDELARQIIAERLDPSRQALEDMAVEAHRAHRITGAQLCRLLGIPPPGTNWRFSKETWRLVGIHGEDFRREGDITEPLLARRGRQNEQERGNR